MATPHPEVREILATLGETPLAWMVAYATTAVAALPERRARTGTAGLEAANEQLEAIEQAVLEPARRELAATQRIGRLAEELGLSRNVELLLESEGEPRRIVLNSAGRLATLETFVGALDRALSHARARVVIRGRGRQ